MGLPENGLLYTILNYVPYVPQKLIIGIIIFEIKIAKMKYPPWTNPHRYWP